MNQNYEDILSRIKEEPKWWDEHGVPRYCDFHPDWGACIYADQVALLLIRCQGCHRKFKVVVSHAAFHSNISPKTILKEGGLPWYSDPPNVKCCPAGPTMTSETLEVLEYWERSKDTGHEWRKVEIGRIK